MRRVLFGFAFVPFFVLAACAVSPQMNEAALQPQELMDTFKLTPPEKVESPWVACVEEEHQQGAQLLRFTGLVHGGNAEFTCSRNEKGGPASRLVVLMLDGTRYPSSKFAMESFLRRSGKDAFIQIEVSEEVTFRPWPYVGDKCQPMCGPAYTESVYTIRYDNGKRVSHLVFGSFNIVDRARRKYYTFVPVFLTEFSEVSEALIVKKFNEALRGFPLDVEQVPSSTAWLR
jgi:hypothetical protein